MALISLTPKARVSGCAARRSEDLSNVSDNDLGIRDSMKAESIGVYEVVSASKKSSSLLSSDGIGPIVWRGTEQKVDVGHHQARDSAEPWIGGVSR